MKKKTSKQEREQQVLMGLVDLYVNTGKPIGSHTLKECGFEHLSSATIRNYFSKLEEEGFLIQQHTSGGRIPTPLAYRVYASYCRQEGHIDSKDRRFLKEKLITETKEVVSYLQQATETISELTQCATFLSSARFDQDFITDIKLLPIDDSRCLCAIITDFGLISTEIIRAEKKLTQFMVKRIESFFRYKITGRDAPSLSVDEEILAKRFYNEIMLRHIVGHTNFSHPDLYKTGFSRLLSYEDFADVGSLANALSLFENDDKLRNILADTQRLGCLNFWIGDDLSSFTASQDKMCSVISSPYNIHHTIAGSFGILGPLRIPYKRLIGILQIASECISETLTKSVYKFKISFRRPSVVPSQITTHPFDMDKLPLLEDKSIN